jgi:hypothetical protein
MPKTDPIMGYLPHFHIQQLRQFKRSLGGPLAAPLPAPPLSYPSEMPGSSTTQNVISVPQENNNTMGPTQAQVNQGATNLDSDLLNNDQDSSSCTCTICQRELHNMASEYVDQEHGFHREREREDGGERSSRHKLKRCTAVRRTRAGRA